MKQDQEPLVNRMPDGPLTERERQETRYANHKIIDEMVSSSELRAWGEKVDRLWWAFGWLVLTITNWKALALAAGLIMVIGGQDMLQLISTRLSGEIE